MPITVYVKNMAGDQLSVELSAGSSVEQLIQTLSKLDCSQYPSYRTHIYRSSMEEKEEEKSNESVPLEDGEVVSVFVSDPYVKETGFFDEDISIHGYVRSELKKGAPYTRFIVPMMNKTIYLYVMGCENRALYHLSYIPSLGKAVFPCFPNQLLFLTSFTSEMNDIYVGYRLYDVMKDMFHSITPGQMKILYDIIDSHYKDSGYFQSYNRNENVMCECGSIVRRMNLLGHYTTKKHLAFMKK
jgi:hypothetical protein